MASSKNIEEELPSLPTMLVSMDSASRIEQEELKNTMKALITRAELDGVAVEEYLKMAILIAFRNRNHTKSLAVGVGAGERLIMLTILRVVSEVAPELVVRVLPLMPMYGSWRDVRLLGDMMFVQDKESASSSSSSSSSAGNQQVRAAVSSLFASQLKRDLDASGLSLDGKEVTKKARRGPISLACKYAPSSSRHRGCKKTRESGGGGEGGRIAEGAATGKGKGRIGGKGKGGKGRGKGGSLFSAEAAAAAREGNHESQSAMADEVASALGLRKTHLKADLRKLVVSPLNALLTEEGYLIDRLLVEKRCSEIRFRRAGKSALEKNKKAINKDPVAARRWKALMETFASAVPDIDDLFTAAQTFLDNKGLPQDDEMVVMSQRAISKAVYDAVEERNRLALKAKGLLTQLSKEATGSDAAVEEATLALESVEVPCLVVVDLGTATSYQHAIAMLLGGFITTRAQERQGLIPLGSGTVIVHFKGDTIGAVTLPYTQQKEEESDDVDMEGAAEQGGGEIVERKANTEPASSKVDGIDFAEFCRLVNDIAVICDTSNTSINTEALKTAASYALNEAEIDVAATNCYGDILVLCGQFDCGHDSENLQAVVEELKASPQENQMKLRALLVHRVKPSSKKAVGVAVPFIPRKGLRPLPACTSDAVVDVCFMMDLTASMSSWIAACKQHLTSIIRDLESETGVGNFRVGFVGYRDYRDRDRIVSIDFKPMSKVHEVVSFIADERASGGADEPEDVVIGLTQVVDKMSWKGDIRLCVHIADATGHGLTKNLSYASDDYPKGTPDQKETTSQVCCRLADAVNGPGVDMLFCQLNDRTADLEAVYAETWGSSGYGVLPLLQGSGAFKEAIMSTLSTSLLSMITPEMSNVQTFDGSNLSATLSAMNANYKESLQSAGKALVAVSDAKMKQVADKAKKDEKVVGVEEEEETSSKMVDVEEDSTGVKAASEIEEAEIEEAAKKTEKVREEPGGGAARGDYERLMMDLEGEDLTPVRIALQMPVGHGGMLGLSEKAARTLIENGISLAQIKDAGYPESIVETFKNVGDAMVQRIA